MTGYGESSFVLEGVRFTFRLKSVNSKYLEPVFNYPSDLIWFEPGSSEILKNRLQRGRVEVTLENSGSLPRVTNLNNVILQNYQKIFQDYYGKKKMQIPIEVLVQLPGLIELNIRDWQQYRHKFEFYFLRALIRLQRTRQTEGRKITQWSIKHLRYLSRLNRRISELHEQSIRNRGKIIRHRLFEAFFDKEKSENSKDAFKLNLLRKIWYEKKDEIVQLLQSDLNEEISRINMHIPEIINLMKQKAPAGREIEFYLQELLREVNTLGAKTVDGEINRMSIFMKTEIEKLREQARNLE